MKEDQGTLAPSTEAPESDSGFMNALMFQEPASLPAGKVIFSLRLTPLQIPYFLS